MKKIITLSIICVLLLSFNVGKAQVFTSGFETWSTATPPKPTDWWGSKTNFSKADSTAQYTASVHGGTYAIKLQSRTASSKRLTTQATSVTAATSYTITFWLRGHGSIRTGLYRGGGTSSTSYIYNPSYITVNSLKWTQQTQTIASDTSSATAQFILAVKSTFADSSDVQVDDVNITAASTPTVTIHDIQYSASAPYASAYNGQTVITGGIVTARYNKGFFIQDGFGPWHGVYVYDSAHAASAGIARGDSVTLAGTVSEYYTYTEIGTVTNITKVSSGNTLHAAYPTTVANLTTEDLEGVLVTLTNLPCVDTVGTAKYGEWAVLNGTDTTRTGGLLYKYTTATIAANYDITGVVYESYNVVRVEPRDINDVSLITGVNEIAHNNVSICPNPVSNILSVNNMEGVNTIKISNLLGETIENIKVSGVNTTINVSRLSTGIYFISLFNEKGIIETKKFAKN